MNLKLELSTKDANRVLQMLVLIDVFLVLLYASGPSLGLPGRVKQMFDLDGEATIPAWIASSQLLITGLLFLIVGQTMRTRAEFSRAFVPLLGAFFIALSVDEASGIHETVTALLQRYSFFPRFAGGHGIWIAIYVAIGLILAFLVRRDIRTMFSMFPKETFLLATGLSIFIAGGIGLEIFSYSIINNGGAARMTRWIISAEEFLELIGISIALYSSLLFAVRFN
jgi:hypothetical protein